MKQLQPNPHHRPFYGRCLSEMVFQGRARSVPLGESDPEIDDFIWNIRHMRSTGAGARTADRKIEDFQRRPCSFRGASMRVKALELQQNHDIRIFGVNGGFLPQLFAGPLCRPFPGWVNAVKPIFSGCHKNNLVTGVHRIAAKARGPFVTWNPTGALRGRVCACGFFCREFCG